MSDFLFLVTVNTAGHTIVSEPLKGREVRDTSISSDSFQPLITIHGLLTASYIQN